MTAIDNNRVWHDLFPGFITIYMRHHAAHGERYGLALIKELERHGYPVSPGTMYPVLHDMERIGDLSWTKSLVGGKVRQDDSITDEGQQALADAQATMGERVDEVKEGDGPTSWPHVDTAHSEGNHDEL